MARGVRVSGADVFVLERFELLLGAEFVGLEDEVSGRKGGTLEGWGNSLP